VPWPLVGSYPAGVGAPHDPAPSTTEPSARVLLGNDTPLPFGFADSRVPIAVRGSWRDQEPPPLASLPSVTLATPRGSASSTDLIFGDEARGSRRTGTVTGRVTDAGSQQPLAGASIIVVGTQLGVVAGADGRFTLNNVPPGTQRVRASLIGYASLEETVEVTTG